MSRVRANYCIDKDEANSTCMYPSSSRRKSDSRRELFVKMPREMSIIRINRNRFFICAQLLTFNINILQVLIDTGFNRFH